jgi:diacylglycerol kinase (ATP)
MQPKIIMVDCGKINNSTISKHFINNFGLGFDGFVSELVNESKVKKALNKIGLGKLSYAYFVAQALIQFRPFTLTVQNDSNEQQFENVWFATVSNQPYYGGGMNLSPTSKVDDGVLEVTVVNNLPRLKFLLLFLTVFAGKHTKFKAVTQFKIKEATFTADKLLPIHTDGETAILLEPLIRCEVVPDSVIIVK